MFKRSFSRGSSILAALVFIGILSAVAFAMQSLSPSANPRALTAEAGDAMRTAPANAPVPTARPAGADDTIAQKCAAAIAQAKTAKTTKTSAKAGQDVTDDCVAAIPDSTQKSGYKCVGKSATVQVAENGLQVGAISIKAKPNANMPPGKCATLACRPTKGSGIRSSISSVVTLGGTLGPSMPATAQCSAVNMDGIDYASVTKNLSQDNTFGMVKSPSTAAGVIVSQSIDPTSQSIMNNALGRQPDDTSRNFTIGKDGNLPDPNEALLAKIAAENPDAAAVEASQKTTEVAFQINPNLADAADLKPDSVTPSTDPRQTVECYGNVCYPANEADAKKLESAGYKCKEETAADDAVCTKAESKTPIPKGDPRKNDTFGGKPGPDGQAVPDKSSGGGGMGGLSSILQGLLKGLTGAQTAPAQACATDPNAYQQQQQQYNQQLQQYNQQLQQYNYQRQMSQYNGMPEPIAPVAPQPCQQTSSSNTCAAAPAQPAASGCANGTWKPVSTQQSNGASCTTGWQCVPTGSGAPPTAQISCQPLVADVGMSIAISYSCTNATASGSTDFATGGALSGTTTVTVANPPANTNTVTYGVGCSNGNSSQTAAAQCTVQVGKPSIVLVANPKIVASGASSTIGWITSSMKACVVSSPEMAGFTAANAGNTSVNGMAVTPAITSDVGILLHCTTLAGGVRDATTTIQVATSTTP